MLLEAVLLQSHDVDRQESQGLPGRYRRPLRAAEHPIGRDGAPQSPAVGAVWEPFVFAQLRRRERQARRTGGLFFWRDGTREVDFVADRRRDRPVR